MPKAKKQETVITNKVAKDSTQELILQSIKTALPVVMEKELPSLIRQAVKDNINELICTAIENLNCDGKFTSKFEEGCRAVFLTAINAINLTQITDSIESHLESAVDDFDYCDLSDVYSEMLQNSIRGSRIQIITSPKKKKK